MLISRTSLILFVVYYLNVFVIAENIGVYVRVTVFFFLPKRRRIYDENIFRSALKVHSICPRVDLHATRKNWNTWTCTQSQHLFAVHDFPWKLSSTHFVSINNSVWTRFGIGFNYDIIFRTRCGLHPLSRDYIREISNL